MGIPTLKLAESTGEAFLKRLGVADIKAARAMSAENIQKSGGGGMGVGGFSSAPNTQGPDVLVPKIQQAKDKLSLLWIGCGDKDNLITSSWNLHQGLVKAKIDHVWHSL